MILTERVSLFEHSAHHSTKPLSCIYSSRFVSPCRHYATAVEYGGFEYLYGGLNAVNQFNYLGDLWRKDLSTGGWTQLQSPSCTLYPARLLHTAVVYKDAMIVMGGQAQRLDPYETPLMNDVLVFNFTTMEWSCPAHRTPSKIGGHCAVVHGDLMYACSCVCW